MQILQTRTEILKLLNWTEQRYNQYLFDCAVQYMSGFIPDYPQIVSQILKSSIFWNWWRYHWMVREMEFIKQCAELPIDADIMVELYNEVHDPRTLLTAIFMSGQVLEHSYSVMINELTDAQFKKEEVLP